MKLYMSLPKDLGATCLSIGTFDGVHLGHQAIFRRMKELSSHTTLLTFLNHPREVLQPHLPPPKLLTPLTVKLSLIEKMGIDCVILLPFTKELADTEYDELLDSFSLSHLVFGKGALFGKERKGSEENVKNYAKEKGIYVEYLEKKQDETGPISSSRIRKLIEGNEIEQASSLLGRPFFSSCSS